MNQFKDLTLEYDAASGMTVKVYTDLPGTALALRRTLTFPASSGRRTYVAPYDDSANGYALVEGTLIKYRVESTGVVRLYRGIQRFRKLGVYFDGARGEMWETLELAL